MTIENKIKKLVEKLWFMFGELNGTEYDKFIKTNYKELEKLQTILNQILI